MNKSLSKCCGGWARPMLEWMGEDYKRTEDGHILIVGYQCQICHKPCKVRKDIAIGEILFGKEEHEKQMARVRNSMTKTEMKEEFEKKQKEIEEKGNVLLKMIDSLNPEAREKFLMGIQPEIRKLEKINESLKEILKEKK